MRCVNLGEDLMAERKGQSDFSVIIFIIVLCFVCGLLLSIAAYFLSDAQAEAKEFDQSKQMLIAAKVLDYDDSFQLMNDQGRFVPARFDAQKGLLIEADCPEKAKEDDIKKVASLLIRPLLTDKEGNVFTLEEKGVTLEDYLSENKKTGYAALALKLFYAILPSDENTEAIKDKDVTKDLSLACTFVIPVSGFGLWAPIYGYMAIAQNGDSVIGTTWYEHAETPGLGANITEPWWQNQFFNKVIFQEPNSGQVDFCQAPIGIIVVKGKVKDVFGTSPKAKSAVDGMSGATLTGDGVTQAYKNSLSPYREFFIKLKDVGKKSTS